MFAWTNEEYSGPAIIGGISSYPYMLKVDLTDYNPSMWNFNGSTVLNGPSCSEWITPNITCYGSMIENYVFVVYA